MIRQQEFGKQTPKAGETMARVVWWRSIWEQCHLQRQVDHVPSEAVALREGVGKEAPQPCRALWEFGKA